MTLVQDIVQHAHALGFDLVGVTSLDPPPHAPSLPAWLADGCQGDMDWMARWAHLRVDPRQLAPEARSMVVVGARYDAQVTQTGAGHVARYAWGPDYHTVIKRQLFALDAAIRARTGRTTQGRACVDSAPLLERDLACRAGLGFVGRNTCLITPGLGSWTFLAALLVPEALMPQVLLPEAPNGESSLLVPASFPPSSGTCGRCRRCLDACPTGALTAPYRLDARLCISYLTIEYRGVIPLELRPLMGIWVFGCDVCQEVCPHNLAAGRRAGGGPGPSRSTLFVPDLRIAALSLEEILRLDEAGFRARFAGTALKRAGRAGLVRNACIAAGNSGDANALPALALLLRDPEPIVRGHAAWALGCSRGAWARDAIAAALAGETVAWVRQEMIASAEVNRSTLGE